MEKLKLAELKNKALGFDRAEMRDVHIVKDDFNYRSPRHVGIWNVDRKELACLARKNYTAIQHRHVVDCVIEALSSLNIKAEASLGVSKHGIHVDFDFPESKFELSEVGESFTSGMRVINDYSKPRGLVIAPRVTRLACSNGMVVTEVVKAKRIRYTEQLGVELQGIIDKLVKDIIAGDEKLAGMVSVCIKDSIEWTALRLLTRQMFKQKKHIRNILARVGADKNSFSRWDFYNAVTDYATHGERLNPHVEAWLHGKAQEIMKTSFNDLVDVERSKVTARVSAE